MPTAFWNFTESVLNQDSNALSIFHQYKWNGFFCESGKLLVRVWQNDQADLIDETILKPGDFTRVRPGFVHQFEGLEDGVAFELYWAEFSHDDIIRKTVGSSV